MYRFGRVLLRTVATACPAIVALGPLLIVVLLVVVLPVAGWFIFGDGRFMGTTFTSSAWAQAGSCAGPTDWKCEEKWMRCERGRMLRSLTRNHLLIGKFRRDEAIALLGSGFFGSTGSAPCIRYRLGYCSVFGFGDQDYLKLCFDETDLLVSSGRYRT